MKRLAFLFLSLILLSAPAFPQTSEILNQAKKESEVVLYTTMTVRDLSFSAKPPKKNIRSSTSAMSTSARAGKWRASCRNFARVECKPTF